MSTPDSLAPDDLRWTLDPQEASFETTDDLETLDGIVGQERAKDAIEFGIGIDKEGYNLFALGPPAMGKHDIVERYLESRADDQPQPSDWCYVHNFDEEKEPQVLEMPPGRGCELSEDMEQLIEELKAVIPAAFESEDYQTRKQAIDEEFHEKQEKTFEELREEAEREGITVIRTPAGIALAPVKDGEVVPPDEFDKLPDEEREEVEEKIKDLQRRFEDALKEVPRWERKRRDKLKELNREVTQFAVDDAFDELRAAYEDLDEVQSYLDDVEEDVVQNASDFVQAMRFEQMEQQAQMPQQQGPGGQQGGNPMQMAAMQQQMGGQNPAESKFRRYKVNVLVNNGETDGAPVVYEDNPTLENLLGRTEYVAQFGALQTDFNLIQDGALHRANGGYLVLDARKVLMNRLSWEQLKRALFSDEIKIESTREIMGLAQTVSLEPEPIPLDVKIVLIGGRRLYYLLSQHDPEFAELFKVSVDFEEEMDRNDENSEVYAEMIATHVEDEDLRPFDASAVSRVMARSSRLAEDQEKLSTRTEKIKDLLREADYWAGEAEHDTVLGEDVQQAIDAHRRRNGRIEDKMQEYIERETILIDTEGEEVGQINGLSVLKMDDYSFGRPNRITARARMGSGEVVDIEREVELGGPIHSKGVLILAGFLGARYAEEQPLSLSASLVFEQSYGGIEGDSASLAETCALLSALSEVPIRQELAITGSMNQHGRVQAIGGANDKIEGFFEVCQERGLTGEQGVVIPASNVKNLMLSDRVVDAVEAGDFHIYPVESVDEAIELMLDREAGEADQDGQFPEGSVNRLVRERLAELAETARKYASEDDGDAED